MVPAGHVSLIGRDWIRCLKLDLRQTDADMVRVKDLSNSMLISDFLSVDTKPEINDIFKEFSEIFEQKIGCVPNFQISLSLREKAKPVYTREKKCSLCTSR